MFVKVTDLEQQRAQSALLGVEARAGVRARVFAWVKKAGPVFALAALLAVCVPGVARGIVMQIQINRNGTSRIDLTETKPYYKNGGAAAGPTDYNAYFNYADQSLTLKGFQLQYDGSEGMMVADYPFGDQGGYFTLIPEGDNRIEPNPNGTLNPDTNIGFKSDSDSLLIIKGDGRLTAKGGGENDTQRNRYGMEINGLEMQSGTVHGEGGRRGLVIRGNLQMTGGHLTGVSPEQSIQLQGQLTAEPNIKQWAGKDETDALSGEAMGPDPTTFASSKYVTLREAYQISVNGGTRAPDVPYFWTGREANVTADDPTLFSRWEVVTAPTGFALPNPNVSPAIFAMPVGDVSLQAHYKPTSITLNETTLPLTVGGTQALAVTDVQPNYADRDVTWTSSNLAVATVDANGNVTAVAPGTAIITATSAAAPDVTATCNVTVTNPPSPPSPPPQTGDPAPLALWAMLGSISLACAAMFLHRMRKRA